MIEIRKEIEQIIIDSEKIKHNVDTSIKYCGYPSNKKNIFLLTLLFISVQLFNQFAINNNIEPLSLKQLNKLDRFGIHKDGGKKYNRKKSKKKKKRTKYNVSSKNKNIIRRKSNIRKNSNYITMFTDILSKITLGLTLLMIILSSLGTVDAQVSSVGMPFNDFVDVIHNTGGIGKDPLTYKEQHDLTVNYGELYNKKPTFVKGYCTSISAVSAGLITISEFKQLLINTGAFKEIKARTNSSNYPDLSTRLLARPRMDFSYTLDSKTFPQLSQKQLERLQADVYHPGLAFPFGFSIADISNTNIVTTVFEIKKTKQKNIPSHNIVEDSKDMINIVHKKLIEDRLFSLKNNFIKENDVVSGIITYPGHAMTITVLPSGSLLLRNADSLHLATTGNWLKYKPPLNVDLNDQSLPETKQVMYEWNLLNKVINPLSRKYNQYISRFNLNLTPSSEWSSIEAGSFFKTPILSSDIYKGQQIPKDTLTPFFISNFERTGNRQIKLTGHISSDKYSEINKNNTNNTNKTLHVMDFYEKLKDVKCGAVSRENLSECIRNMNIGETITINKGSYNLKTSKLNVFVYNHTPNHINTTKQKSIESKSRKSMIRNSMFKLHEQAEAAGKAKRVHEPRFINMNLNK